MSEIGQQAAIIQGGFDFILIIGKRSVVVHFFVAECGDRDMALVYRQLAVDKLRLVVAGDVVAVRRRNDETCLVNRVVSYGIRPVGNAELVDFCACRMQSDEDSPISVLLFDRHVFAPKRLAVVNLACTACRNGDFALEDRERTLNHSYGIVVGDVIAVCIANVGCLESDFVRFCIDDTIANGIDLHIVSVNDGHRVFTAYHFDLVGDERESIVNFFSVCEFDGNRARSDAQSAVFVRYRIVFEIYFIAFKVKYLDFKDVVLAAFFDVLYLRVACDSCFLPVGYRILSFYTFAFRDVKLFAELFLSVVYETHRFRFYGYRTRRDFECAVNICDLVVFGNVFLVAVLTYDCYVDGDYVFDLACIGKRSKFVFADFMLSIFKQAFVFAVFRVSKFIVEKSGCIVNLLVRNTRYGYRALVYDEFAVNEFNLVVLFDGMFAYGGLSVLVVYNDACGINSVWLRRGRVSNNGELNHACLCAL